MNVPKLPETFDLERWSLELGLQTEAGRIALRYALEQVLLLDKKQQDYGPRNISGFGTFGVVVRMNDKFERVKNLFGKRQRKAQNESIYDSFMDICNYALIARMLHDNNWPKE